MQSSTLPRTSQRRQGIAAEMNMDQSQQQRTSSIASTATARTHTSRSSNPDKQISQIEKSVTHLLVATKQLLETLTQWSRGNAQEEEVSDVYVRLGYEFNLACRAFNSINVDTSDLGPVPDLLRTILEDTLSQPASPQALDNYLPRIRDIIINLLQGLKRKQSKLRSRPTKDVISSSSSVKSQTRQTSTDSTTNSGVTLVDAPGPGSRRDSPSGLEMTPEPDIVPVMNIERNSLRRSVRRDPQKISSDSSSTMSSTTAQDLPVIAPSQLDTNGVNFPHAPPPPPKQDALTALQKGGDLERRASRRFSAYQISKHLGSSPNSIPQLPPTQNSPIPNRGREARESMRAVNSRTAQHTARQKSTSKLAESPSRSGTVRAPPRISEEREEPPELDTQSGPKIEPPLEEERDDSPIAKTPDEYLQKENPLEEFTPQLGATVNGPFSPTKELPSFPGTGDESYGGRVHSPAPAKALSRERLDIRSTATPPPAAIGDLDSSPASTKELTLFLQYKTRIKKFVLPGGQDDLSMARLQLAFIERFAWNTHSNGADLPEIYLQDPVSGIRHELEDLRDVRDRSVLVLQIEVLDEVKKHFDESIGGLKSTLDGVRSLLDGQSTMMQRFSDRQLEASKEMARINTVPTSRLSRAATIDPSQPIALATESQVAEVANLRRDIAVLRQTYTTMSTDFAASMQDIKAKASVVKSAAEATVTSSFEGGAGRAHVNEGKKSLMTDSEALVTRVDNLADTVDDLRRDVVSRGVRPRPHDLEVLSKEISAASKDLGRVKEFIKREKPIWTKTWEAELNLVCTEREDLTQQEELVGDLFGDLADVQDVFNLVEEAMKQQALSGQNLRSMAKTIEVDPTVDPNAVKEGVLDEVRALRPNHEDRLEAIERAERLRERENKDKKLNPFQKEVASVVEEGRLKKTGGMDEVERVRKIKDEKAYKDMWENQRLIDEEKARKKAEREAKKAAAAKAAAAKAAEEQVKETEVEPEKKDEVVNGVDVKENGEHLHTSESEAFADAPTGTTPQMPPLPMPELEKDDGPPVLPTIEVGEKSNDEEKKEKTQSLNHSQDWWKPAVF